MSTLSCHVYYDHTDQNAPYWVSIGLLTCTSHLTAITFREVSPNPMAVPSGGSRILKSGFQYAIKARVARLLGGSGGMSPTRISDLLR